MVEVKIYALVYYGRRTYATWIQWMGICKGIRYTTAHDANVQDV